ncbi:VapB protein of antitoxin of type II toxin-antitoxin system [Glaciihabitans tibetensis]|uniref:VapB protein of antitoxin of type II toxin-antitoxin system n=1 Tax=Glaciihabitans tibetensis TaxID=1266600 RepID=A0A2T0VGL4_9MICO|nr:type II toxin-antitoxin system VapB family antitoxin [Glaciihabitans tibetensis]PRY69357.1 VapB protein of antitoxin of type II toxin-antitoxin system [Glaciihabitans tibetensis]
MRTTVTVSDELLARAAELTGRDESSVLLRLGLEALIERESSRRLALLGGSDPSAVSAPRSRTVGK